MKYTQISVSRMRRASAEEKKDRRKGRFLAFFLHMGMLVLAIWPFLYELPEERTADIKVVMVDFRDPPQQETSGSSRSGASAPSIPGVEAEVVPEPTPIEEIIPPTPEPEPTPIEPEPEPKPKDPEPIPAEITPSPQPELITTTTPQPVRIPPVPPSPPVEVPEPEIESEPIPEPESTPAPPASEPRVEQEAAPEPVKRKPLNERIADFFKDNEYSGKDESGTGSGRTTEGKADNPDGRSNTGSSGTGETGDGDSNSGNRANGFGDGWIEGMGKLSRIKISSPPIADLVKEVGRVVVKVCINKRGTVVYAKYDAENSTLSDIGHKQRAIKHVQKIVFERKDNAPDKECGRLTFKMTRSGWEEGE